MKIKMWLLATFVGVLLFAIGYKLGASDIGERVTGKEAFVDGVPAKECLYYHLPGRMDLCFYGDRAYSIVAVHIEGRRHYEVEGQFSSESFTPMGDKLFLFKRFPLLVVGEKRRELLGNWEPRVEVYKGGFSFTALDGKRIRIED